MAMIIMLCGFSVYLKDEDTVLTFIGNTVVVCEFNIDCLMKFELDQ